MQALVDLKELNDQRFDCIDRRWGQVEDALRLEQKERQLDVSLLRDRLQDRVSVAENLEKSKAKVLKDNLDVSMREANECKENLEECFDFEAGFRVGHLDKKNAFIQAYAQTGEEFIGRFDDYQKEKIREITNRLESIDAINHEATKETVRMVKEEKIAETKAFFDEERSRFTDLLARTRTDASKEVDSLRASLREYAKRKEESDAKLQLMIGALGAEMAKLQEVEWKEGEITYDCLLKVVEDACARIQEAQFK